MGTFAISEDVQDETLEVLAGKFPRLRKDAREALSLLRTELVSRGDYAGQLGHIPVVRDPKDAHVLAAAMVSACDLLVTGDRGLLELRRVGRLKIVRASGRCGSWRIDSPGTLPPRPG